MTNEIVLLSVMGPHAGEDSAQIFARKIKDTLKIGKTFWLVRSYKAKPPDIQALCEKAVASGRRVQCLFMTPSSNGGADQTESADKATEYSQDRLTWLPLPKGMGPVTGLMTSGAVALVFDELNLEEQRVVDLWQYAEWRDPSRPIIIRQGASTVCAVRKDMSNHSRKMRGNIRQILAVGRLAKPYAVWLR